LVGLKRHFNSKDGLIVAVDGHALPHSLTFFKTTARPKCRRGIFFQNLARAELDRLRSTRLIAAEIHIHPWGARGYFVELCAGDPS